MVLFRCINLQCYTPIRSEVTNPDTESNQGDNCTKEGNDDCYHQSVCYPGKNQECEALDNQDRTHEDDYSDQILLDIKQAEVNIG